MRKLKRFAGLSSAKQALFLRALFALLAIRAGLLLLPFKIVRRVALRAGRKSEAGHPVNQLIWAVEAASRCLPGTTCLPQALAAQFLLARFGHPSRVEIGVIRDRPHDFQAHAWLVFGGQVVIGGPAVDRYASLAAWETKP